MNSKLTKSAQSIIDSYQHLPFEHHDIACPYLNNRKNTKRGALRVNIGKGTAQEIVEETEMLAHREHVKLSELSNDDLKKFLVDHGIGIDCSAFTYYILNAAYKEKHGKELKQLLLFPHAKNPLRKLLTKMRPVENTSVKTLAHKKNSEEISLKDIQVGDMIIMMNGGPRKDYNHVLIITSVEKNEAKDSKTSSPVPLPTSLIKYTHSFTWPTDGKHNHGIKQGEINITNINKPILDQLWTESGKIGEENWTYMHGKSAEKVFVVRLLIT